MKALRFLPVLAICLTVFPASLAAAANTDRITDMALVEENLMIGLKSDNEGLQHSTAYQLGEFKAKGAVIDLMRMLHNEKQDAARILAALSLIKIGDARGVYAVMKAATYDKSPRVRRLCTIFYNAYKYDKESIFSSPSYLADR